MRLFIVISVILYGLSAQAAGSLQARGLLEIQVAAADSDQDLFSGGLGKFRYDDDTFPLRLGKLGLHLDYQLTDTLWFRSMGTAYLDGDIEGGLNEAYLQYRPVPKGPMRIRAKLGAFYMPVSLENRNTAWSSKYSTSFSTINSWLAAEMRTMGAEITLSWPGRFRQSPHDLSVTASLYGFNDGAGTALDIQGWTSHDRQTGLFEKYTLPVTPTGQKRGFYPFREIDDRPGYYVQASWRYLGNLQLKLTHYDNRADYSARRDNQNAWDTRFQHLSIEYELKRNWTLIGQAIIGDTVALNRNNTHLYKSDYSSAFLLLNHTRNKHIYSARIELFDVDEKDDGSTASSEESGFGLMLYYEYRIQENLGLSAEWSHIYSERNQRLAVNQFEEHENQFLMSIKYQF